MLSVCLASCDRSGTRTRARTCRPSSRSSAVTNPHQRLGRERVRELSRFEVDRSRSFLVRRRPRLTSFRSSRFLRDAVATESGSQDRQRGFDRCGTQTIRKDNPPSHQGEFVHERVLELNVADSFLFVGLSCSQGRERDTERGAVASLEPASVLLARARSRRSIARALGSAAMR